VPILICAALPWASYDGTHAVVVCPHSSTARECSKTGIVDGTCLLGSQPLGYETGFNVSCTSRLVNGKNCWVH
jgi:hypothetical protein